MDKALRSKVSPADLVQEVYVTALRDFVRFHSSSWGEVHAWLRRMLLYHLRHLRRHFAVQKRAADLEQAVADLRGHLAAPERTPSADVQENEERSLLERALGRLPAEHQQVVASWCEGLAFPEIGRSLDRTAEAARKLWKRAVASLRRELGERN